MSHLQILDGETGNVVALGIMDKSELQALPDEDLLKHSLKSPSAFEALMQRYQREFLARAQAVVKSRDDAEDIVQETFVRVYRFAPKFSPQSGTFRSWSLTILMNVARTRYQKQVRERGVFAELQDSHFESLADPKNTHDVLLNKDEVERVLQKVDAETAEILTLAYLDGLPYEEIATLKSTSVGAVKARVHRARAAARNALATPRV